MEAVEKRCVHCGTSRTPQWREGPAGPKTLCNACGVRRYREKNLSDKPGGSIRAPRLVTLEAEDPDIMHDHAIIPSTEVAVDSLHRGKRKAAERAQLRTHAFANTGEWNWEGEMSESPKKPAYKRPEVGSRRQVLDKSDKQQELKASV